MGGTNLNLTDYGWNPGKLPPDAAQNGHIPARITAVHKERYALVCEYGEGFGRLKTGVYYYGAEPFPTTGDFVLLQYNPGGDAAIVKTLPRTTYFSRLDPSSSGHAEQAVAANFDYVLLLQSLNRDFNPKRLERYVTLAWQSGATPVVVLTKADLAEDYGALVRAAEGIAPGIAVHAVSAVSGEGLDALSPYLRAGKTLVLLGSSGVGKSSLVNALAGELCMETGEIREDDSRGRHTTTHRQLIMLKNGVMIIDTPGMRELGMWDVRAGLGEAFGDVEQYFGQCRFTDCKHQNEPGCAVKAAIEHGELSAERWSSYLRLKREAKYSDDRGAYLRERQQWHKTIAGQRRQINQNRGDAT